MITPKAYVLSLNELVPLLYSVLITGYILKNTGGLQRLYCQSMMDGRLFCVVVVTFDLAPFCLQLHRILCFIVAEVLQALAVLAMPLLLMPFQIKMKP